MKHTEEEITNHNGLNRSEFAAAARYVSTPFVEKSQSPKVRNLAVVYKHTMNDMPFQKIHQTYLVRPTMQTTVKC